VVKTVGGCWGVLWILVVGFAGDVVAAPPERSAEPTSNAKQPSSPTAEADRLTVPIPPGETLLADIGIYRVFWQSYGKEPTAMPLAWTGHFDARCGISYQAWGRVLQREALLMHSPWHVPPGKAWVDYRLALPRVAPIRLSFGIAMGPDVVAPDKSDGVTFSCALTAGGRQRELLRRHHDKGAWLDYAFDLSEHAGQTVVVRLQVEPGPRNNASFDYSFFGDAKIVAGAAGPGKADVVGRLTSAPAYRATAGASLTALANRSGQGVAPSNLLPYQNRLEASEGAWQFIYEAADCRIVYAYKPDTGTLDDFLVAVDGGRPFQPARGGGVTPTAQRSGKAGESVARGGKALAIARDQNTLAVVWQYDVDGKPMPVRWTFQIAGKALIVSARCDDPIVGRFSLGDVGLAPLRKSIAVPYLAGRLVYLPVQNVFACNYLDWTASHASQCPQGVAVYEPKTDGIRNPLVEVGYVAVSPDVGEVLPNIPHPASSHLKTLGPRIVLDIWGHHRGTYRGDAENLQALKDHGVDHLAIIQHVWQRFGYDVKLPDHLPADPNYGGDEGMAAFGKVANACGYLWSLHENYIDIYPDAPSYDPAARVLLADGSPSKAWYNPGTRVQSFGLKCNRALGYAKQTAPEAHRRFATTAAYLDVHSCVPPWHQLDHEAGQPMAAMALAKVKYDTELFQFMRDAHGGPLLGEGANHFYWAGRCDGVEAQVIGGEDHAPLLDFDLLKIHPQMVNHGMGYYERWFRRGYEHRWGGDTGTVEQIDKYRAQELAYGHAGFIGAAQVDNIPWVVREHHLMHPVQRLYGDSLATEIRYEVEGRMVGAGVALIAGDTTRQRIRYQSGLTLWVNWRADSWRVQGRVLPQWGFLALGPDTQVWTARRDGAWADYAECPEYVFADARTSFPMPYLHARKDIEPRLKSWEPLGGNRARVTYQWHVRDTLDDDYHCFVHGLSPAGDHPETIAFQQDHPLAKPTSQWRKGDTVVDGPYEIAVPGGADTYQLVVGLHKGNRVPLVGGEESSDRIAIARLSLKREGGKVVGVAAEPIARAAAKYPAVDFKARLNPTGTSVDFGKLATDGSVKINRHPDRLVLFPYPRNTRFRVSLDLKALAPRAQAGQVTVRALAAGTGRDLGPVEFAQSAGRLTLTLGTPGAGRYAIAWK
jgi:hypothetical protein